MSNKEIQGLSSEDAWCWLFGVEEYEKLAPRCRPPRVLDIDREIQGLIARQNRKTAKIRLNMDRSTIANMLFLIDDDDLDPFFAGRHLLWRSLVAANRVLAVSETAQKQTMRIEELTAAADALQRKIETIDKLDIVSLFDNPYNLDGSTFEADDFTQRMMFAEIHNRELKPLLSELHYRLGNLRRDGQAEIARLTPSSNRGDIWRQTLVEGIGYTWRLMTGSNPARGGPFEDFAEAAYRSVGGTDSVERQIRTVLDNVAKRPEYDQFDRDSFRSVANDDGYVPVTEHRDGHRVVQRSAAWAPYYFDPYLDNPDFEPFGEDAEAVQAARRRRAQSRTE
ncbi:hypothetical protein [Bradyrhizobium japonicum]|uniref:hypothetical protein n=1 Tax=Bradyrhizobium japonicum TaxID=375 RepID=UPI000462DC08|nr:hypothetical protein [Bradyrhizobium japonicum]